VSTIIPSAREVEFRESATRVFEHVKHDERPWRLEALMRCAYLLGQMDGAAKARDVLDDANAAIRIAARP
jgi:hypothetical protein|tara:strand:+ start:574 stop:783 length:210 start_codon:yes stop_codon:yes gene_type:complete